MFGARGRKLERERKAVEPAGYGRDHSRRDVVEDEIGVHGARALEEEQPGRRARDVFGRRRLGRAQGGDRDLVLAPDAKRLSARHQDVKGRHRSHDLGDVGRSGEQVLEGVQDEQRLLVPQLVHDRRDQRDRRPRDAHGVRDFAENEGSLIRPTERNEEHVAAELWAHPCGDLDRDPGFADPSRSRQRQETDPRARERVARLIHLVVPPDERSWWDRDLRPDLRGQFPTGARRALEPREVVAHQAEGFGQAPRRVSVDRRPEPALGVAYRARAHLRALGQLLLS